MTTDRLVSEVLHSADGIAAAVAAAGGPGTSSHVYQQQHYQQQQPLGAGYQQRQGQHAASGHGRWSPPVQGNMVGGAGKLQGGWLMRAAGVNKLPQGLAAGSCKQLLLAPVATPAMCINMGLLPMWVIALCSAAVLSRPVCTSCCCTSGTHRMAAAYEHIQALPCMLACFATCMHLLIAPIMPQSCCVKRMHIFEVSSDLQGCICLPLLPPPTTRRWQPRQQHTVWRYGLQHTYSSCRR